MMSGSISWTRWPMSLTEVAALTADSYGLFFVTKAEKQAAPTGEELEKAHPMDFRIPNVMRRLDRAGDVWRDALRAKQSLHEALAYTPA